MIVVLREIIIIMLFLCVSVCGGRGMEVVFKERVGMVFLV